MAQPQDSTASPAPRPSAKAAHKHRSGAHHNRGHAPAAAQRVPGIDVSAYQTNVNWASVRSRGFRFAYVKATQGVKYVSSTFSSQYAGARSAGLSHGAYHYATPNAAGGAAQADYFVAHGGGGRADGHTLPGVLDIEDNPYSGGKCYGLDHAEMVSWIGAFLNEYHARTGRHAVINTFRDWWNDCTGNSSKFAVSDPLWINDHNATAGNIPIPSAWRSCAIWQWTDKGVYGDEDYITSSTLYATLLAR